MRTRAQVSCLSTTASPEAGRDEDTESGGAEGGGSARDGLTIKQRRLIYLPSAYKPWPVSYADILHQVVQPHVVHTKGVLKQLHRALQRSRSGDAPLQPEEAPPPIEHVLERSSSYLTNASERIQAALSAVAQDVSSNAVPCVYTHDFATIRAHHLGRWYAEALALKNERQRIQAYLSIAANSIEKARRIVGSHYTTSVERSLRAQRIAVVKTIHQHQHELQAAAYAMVCQLRAARLAQQWHKAWLLERKLASTASMFLSPQPLASTSRLLFDKDDERMTEISMSRMSEWNDSYETLYEEDAHLRKRVNLVRSYWTILNSTAHEKPWQGEAVVFTARSPTTHAKELIIIRHDQSSPPSPLWPRDWEPLAVTDTKDPSAPKPPGVAHTAKQRSSRRPGGTGGKSIRKGKAGKGSKSKSKRQDSANMQATSDVHEA